MVQQQQSNKPGIDSQAFTFMDKRVSFIDRVDL